MELENHPKTLFIEIGTECNSRCKYCHMWMTKEGDGSLTTDEKVKIINEFKRVNPSGKVVLTGGETMLKYEEFFKLSGECLKLGIFCAANTNASLINDDNLKIVLENGPKYLVISLDSHIQETHDYSRGVEGGFDHTIKILKKLVELKRQIGSKIEIITNSVIHGKNIEYLEDYVLFVENLGIDGCIFQMIGRTFFKKGEGDNFFENNFFKDKTSAIIRINDLVSKLADHKIIRTTRQDFEWMKLYIENPDFIGEQVCGSHEKNVMIDSYGEIQLCFNMKNINNGQVLGNIRDYNYDIQDIWLSERANNVRLIMQECRLNCGMLNCHRKK